MKIPNNIKAVIFDVDGLLIDSEPYWEKADIAFFAKYNKQFSSEINRRIMGMGHREIMEYFIEAFKFPGDRDQLILQRKELLYENLLPYLVLMEGANELIVNLHKRGFALAIATSGHTRGKTLEMLKKLNISHYFSVYVSGDDVKKSKPAPEIYLKTANLLHAEPTDCLVIEDAPNGVLAGKAAGMTVYAVNKDKSLQEELRKAGADEVFANLSEITL